MPSHQYSLSKLLFFLGVRRHTVIPNLITRNPQTFRTTPTFWTSSSWVPRLSWDDFLRVLSASDITNQQDQYSNLLILIFGIQSSPVTRKAASILLSKQKVKFTPDQIVKLVKSNLNLRSDVMDLFLDQMEKDHYYPTRSNILGKIESNFSRGIFNNIQKFLFEAIAYGCIGAVYAIVERYPNALKMKDKNGHKPLHAIAYRCQSESVTPILSFLLEHEKQNDFIVSNLFQSCIYTKTTESLSLAIDYVLWNVNHFVCSHREYNQRTGRKMSERYTILPTESYLHEYIQFQNSDEREAYRKSRNAQVDIWKYLDLCVQAAIRQSPSFSFLVYYYSKSERHSIYFQIELIRYFSSELTRSFDGKSFLQYMLEREPNMNHIVVKHIANGYMKALTTCHPKTGLYPFGHSAIRRRNDRKDCLTNIYELICMNPTSVTPHIHEKGIKEQSEHQSLLRPNKQKDMRIVLSRASILMFFLVAVMIRMYSIQNFDHFQR